MNDKKTPRPRKANTPSPANKKAGEEVDLGKGKQITDTLRQYPNKIGKHGIDDERELNPEE
jgi:hypothetical protein